VNYLPNYITAIKLLLRRTLVRSVLYLSNVKSQKSNPKKNYRTFHYSPFTFCFSLFTFCFLLSCENDIKEVHKLSTKVLGVDEGKNTQSFLSRNGKMTAKLTSPTMLRYQTDTVKVEFPHSLHVDFFDSVLLVESQLFAKFGSYYENDNKVFLRDSVVVFNRNHDSLFCDELYWDQTKGIFYTDKFVRIRQHSPEQNITGTGLTADQNFKWFNLKNAFGPLNLPDSVR
jgi:LPS export ABC transporter protein LptC